MKYLFLFLIPIFSAFAAEEKKEPWSDIINSEQGQYMISVQPEKKRVEVKKISGPGTPPHLRLRILRENDRPLELRLKTMEPVNSPLSNSPQYYTANLKQWNESYVGLELDFSFDKKTWKRLGKTLKKVLP